MTIVFLANNALECLLDSHTIEINIATVIDAWVDVEGDNCPCSPPPPQHVT